MTKRLLALTALGALSIALSGCNNSKPAMIVAPPGNGGLATPVPNPVTPTGTYTQIELLSRPAVKEVFEQFNDHKTTNALEPYAGTGGGDPLPAEIKGTENTLRPPNAGAGSDYGTALQGILYPNEYAVNLADTSGKAAYLGVETGGATGSNFGGRDPNDDVVGISLGALFGNTLAALHVQPEDGEENNCLSKENVTQDPTQMKTASFPYLASPH